MGLCNETSANKEGERLHALGMGQRVGGILAAAFCFLLNLLNRVRKNNYWSAGFFFAALTKHAWFSKSSSPSLSLEPICLGEHLGSGRMLPKQESRCAPCNLTVQIVLWPFEQGHAPLMWGPAVLCAQIHPRTSDG